MRLIAEGRGDRASIAEITEEADIGFGSFYNHFDSKEQLFQTASEEALERWGKMIDRASAGITDPAELFAVGTRITGRLGWTHPEIALSAAVGGMLGLLGMCQRHPERVDEATVDQLTEAELRLLGVPADEAARLAALPLPPIETW